MIMTVSCCVEYISKAVVFGGQTFGKISVVTFFVVSVLCNDWLENIFGTLKMVIRSINAFFCTPIA